MRLRTSVFMILLCPLALAACGTSRLPLSYTTPPSVSPHGPPVVASVGVVDQRGESTSDANWVGAVRGGFGNPLKRLETDRPLTQVVAAAVRQALQARGLLGDANAPYIVQVTITKLESDQVVRREGQVKLQFAWIRGQTGAVSFHNQGDADVVAGSVVTFSTGVFGSVEELRDVLAQAVSQAIDHALDDPALAAFLNAKRD